MNTPLPPLPNDVDASSQATAAGAHVWSNEPLIPDLHDESYRVQDIAHLLGISPDVIRHAIWSGELRAEQAGHEVVCIHRADLLAWLDARGPGV
jgi:excisionase family DNA binding protein